MKNFLLRVRLVVVGKGLIDLEKILCPENFKVFETVDLSRKTVTNRIDAIAADFSFQLAERAKKSNIHLLFQMKAQIRQTRLKF
jgi:hypothetical protein